MPKGIRRGILWIIKMIYLYEKLMYYASISYGFYAQIGQFARDGLLIVTALAVRGYRPTKWIIGIFFLSLLLIAIIGGYILVKLGIPKISNTISNEQNLQMTQILNQQQEILDKMK